MKYLSHKVKFDGIEFDSGAERDRYICLKKLEKEGQIESLELQKRFEIIPKLTKKVTKTKVLKTTTKIIETEMVDERPAYYTCDFFYFDMLKGVWIVEELKSVMTAKLTDYILRRKLIKKFIKEHNGKCLEGEQMEFQEIVSKYTKKKKSCLKQ